MLGKKHTFFDIFSCVSPSSGFEFLAPCRLGFCERLFFLAGGGLVLDVILPHVLFTKGLGLFNSLMHDSWNNLQGKGVESS